MKTVKIPDDLHREIRLDVAKMDSSITVWLMEAILAKLAQGKAIR